MANKLFTKERVKAILKGVYQEVRKMDKKNGGSSLVVRQALPEQ